MGQFIYLCTSSVLKLLVQLFGRLYMRSYQERYKWKWLFWSKSFTFFLLMSNFLFYCSVRSRGGEENVDTDSCPKTLEEWDNLIEKELRGKKSAERKVQKTECRRDENVRRRDQYLVSIIFVSRGLQG